MVKKWIVDIVVKNSNVSDEDIVILKYGLSKMLMFFADTIFTLIWGCFLGIVIESIIFQILYMLLRMCAGGYHFETEGKCKFFSILVTIVSLLFIRFFPKNICIHLVLALLAGIVIVVLSPVEAIKKPLSDVERKINHKRTARIVIVAALIMMLDLVAGNDVFCKPIIVGIYAVGILMVIGKVNYKRVLGLR